MDSEVKMFLIIGYVFLFVGYVLTQLLYVTEPNDLLHCVIDGMYVNDWLDMVLEIDGTGQRTWDCRVQMKPSVTKRLLEIWVPTLRIRDGKQTSWEHRLMQSHEDSDWRDRVCLKIQWVVKTRWRRDRLGYFQQVLRIQWKRRKAGPNSCERPDAEATWQMQTATGSTTTTEKGEW